MIRSSDFVVDAGVAVKWYVPEVHEVESKQFLDPTLTLHVPELFFPEFGNILWKKARLLKVPEISEDEGRDILRLMAAVSMTAHPTAALLEAAYDMAMGTGRQTVYDCLYLALARDLNCRFVTADRAFFDAIKVGSHAPHIHWVADVV